MRLPSISIVTPSYNQGQYLEQTITSILDQSYPGLEYVIIDGGSTDNSVEIIKKYERHLKFWVSEKDKGQANAINKGLQYCKGDVFNWINSDDYLDKGALHKIGASFSDKKVQLVAGRVNNFSTTQSDIAENKDLTAENLLTWKYGTSFVQPGVWMLRDCFIKCGGVDEQFHYAFDWDLLIRYLHKFSEVKYIDDVLVNFRLHDSSKTVQLIERFEQEERKIIEKIATLDEFEDLHKVCHYKIDRTRWYQYLNETIKDESISTTKKLKSIIGKISEQPKDWTVTRMTLAAIKRIVLRQTEVE
jgi:glycosyltransferase involved in cell wall biosynthesis